MNALAHAGLPAWLTWLTLMAGLLGLLALGLSAYGAGRWATATQGLLAGLQAGRVDTVAPVVRAAPGPMALANPGAVAALVRPQVTHYDPREIEGLPAPVQRYFRAVLMPGQPLVAAVTIDMVGRFNLSASGQRWQPFRARQWATTRRPGFVWDARITLLPSLQVRVVDSYVAGQGLLHAAVQGLFTLARVQGEGEIARGELMRWFAEVAWYPTALLPSQGVQWQALDDRSARATLVDGPVTLSLLFQFSADGLIESFRAEARGSMVGQQMVMAPWVGGWSDYQRRDGMLVPLVGEVAWLRPEGRQSYFTGRVQALHYTWRPQVAVRV